MFYRINDIIYIILRIGFYCFSYADDGFDIRNVQINYFLLNDASNRPRYPVLNLLMLWNLK